MWIDKFYNELRSYVINFRFLEHLFRYSKDRVNLLRPEKDFGIIFQSDGWKVAYVKNSRLKQILTNVLKRFSRRMKSNQ